MLISKEGNMKREELKDGIIKLVRDRGQLSITKIANLYNETQYISKRIVREAIKELLTQGILVIVDDVDNFGNKADDVILDEDYEYEGR